MPMKKPQTGIVGGIVMSDNKKIGQFMFGAGAIIEHPTEQKILITKRQNTSQANHEWELVYGRVDNFEELFAGLKREVFEETGLKDLKIKKALRLWHFFRGEKLKETEIYGVTFICQAQTDQVKLNHEHSDFAWVSPEEACQRIKVNGIKQDVELYINYLENDNLGLNLTDTKEETVTFL